MLPSLQFGIIKQETGIKLTATFGMQGKINEISTNLDVILNLFFSNSNCILEVQSRTAELQVWSTLLTQKASFKTKINLLSVGTNELL